MDERGYVPLEILAYQIEGEDGWLLGETQRTLEEFRASLVAEGIPVSEIRSITRGTQRASLKEDDGRLSDVGYHVVIGRGWTWDEAASCWRAPEEMVRLLPGNPVRADGVEVTFSPAKSGWQPVKLSAGGQLAEVDASELYDPFPDILNWLENIVQGGEGRVSADLEGSQLELFAFSLPDPARVRIVIAFMPGREDRTRDVELDVDVDRRLFASAFYSAFRSYADSDAYVVDEWGELTMREDFARKGLDVVPEEMAACSSDFLNETLWKLYPSYIVSFPDASTKGEEIGRFVEYTRSGGEPDGMVRTPDPQYVVPSEFDDWDGARRVEFVNGLLAEVVTPYHGNDLRKLKCEVLDALVGPR